MEIRNGTKIDAGRDAASEVRSTARRGGGRVDAAKEAPASAGGDRVTLTDAAQRLLRSAENEDGAPVDSKRVAEIRAAIENGTYRIDSRKIARALIAHDNPRR
ncbi:MAG: flagellar biosynthesis anti-sigma factor FlgM [Gammaproteobacteria bacterium]|nr:flagellar biosynthesis anti-sigma factor FlgM [Gammaproteobacteria bacterium]